MPLINRRTIDSLTGKLPVARLRLWIVLGLFLALGAYLLKYSTVPRHFSDETLIYDAIWLDAWSLGFVLALAIIWVSDLGWQAKAWLGILALSIFGFVELSVILDGTPFSSNAYWGDQKFRQAMILKFMTLSWSTDFYYKDLPPFYPPLLYWCFAAATKVASLPAFAALKLGGMGIYLLGPALSFLLWRQMVRPLQAWMIVLFTFLTCSFPTPYMLSAPHAFVAIVIFIPWWLHYVEGVGLFRPSLKDYLIGSVLGAIIATVYYFPFFVVATVLVLRLLWFNYRDHFRWRRALVVLSGSFVLSSWFWLPVLLSALEFGFDGAQGRWHHSDSTGVRLLYMGVSYKGILSLAGILFLLTRLKKPLHRSFLILVGTIIPLIAIGSVLGALDHPINLIKARETVWVMVGPAIGLMIAHFIRRWHGTKLKWVAPVLAAVAVVVFVHQFDGYIKSKLVRTARTASIPTWGTDSTEMEARAGSVFWTGHEEIASFYPVYYFIVPNQHYSHPAGRMKARYDLLGILEHLHDPRIVNLALRTNRYDRVDYTLPRRSDSGYEFSGGLNNYPDKWDSRVFHFGFPIFGDTSLFAPEKGDNLFRVLDPDEGTWSPGIFWAGQDGDSLTTVMWLALLSNHLTADGRARLNAYTGVNWAGWRQVVAPEEKIDFCDSVLVKDVRVFEQEDSLHLFFAVEALEHINRTYRAALHFSGVDFRNFDFQLQPPTNTWTERHTVILKRSVPRLDTGFVLSFYFFDRDGVLPGRVDKHVELSATDALDPP